MPEPSPLEALDNEMTDRAYRMSEKIAGIFDQAAARVQTSMSVFEKTMDASMETLLTDYERQQQTSAGKLREPVEKTLLSIGADLEGLEKAFRQSMERATHAPQQELAHVLEEIQGQARFLDSSATLLQRSSHWLAVGIVLGFIAGGLLGLWAGRVRNPVVLFGSQGGVTEQGQHFIVVD